MIAALATSAKRCGREVWHTFLGELRSMAIAIPAARGMFSQMQHALTKRLSPNRIALTQATHAAIEDFRKLADSTCARPTRISEIVPLDPSVVGAHDASGIGAGGVFFAANHVGIHLNTQIGRAGYSDEYVLFI